jgi:plastocyanin
MLTRTLLTLALTAVAAPAFAGSYTAITVKDGGTIKGTITYGGKAPAAKSISVTKDNDICGTSVSDESLVVGPSSGLANTVVFLSDITSGAKAETKTISLDQKGCVYVPHVQATTAGSTLEVLNSDDVLHNVHARPVAGGSAFNLAMPTKDEKLTKTLTKVGVLDLKCDAGHTWMSGYIHVFEHPYFAVTGKDGSFTLTNVPPGTYTLTVWHEKLGQVKQSVTVTANGISTASVEMK